MGDMTTWRILISQELTNNGESWADVVETTLAIKQLNAEFDDGPSGGESCPFTLWTSSRVYFPTEYGGSKSVDSVSRWPDGKPTDHIGD